MVPQTLLRQLCYNVSVEFDAAISEELKLQLAFATLISWHYHMSKTRNPAIDAMFKI